MKYKQDKPFLQLQTKSWKEEKRNGMRVTVDGNILVPKDEHLLPHGKSHW